MDRPVVVAVAPDDPWPPRYGGARRVDAILRRVAAIAALRVVAASSDLPAGAAPAGIERIHVVRSRDIAASIAAMAGGVVAGRPLYMGFYRRRAALAAVRRAVDEVAPDVVVAHWIGGAALTDGVVPRAATILDLGDAEHLRLAALGRAVGGPRGAVWRADAHLVRRWMRRRLPEYRAVALASAEERDRCAEIAPHAHYVVVPNGVDLPPATRSDPGTGPVLFLGDLTYPPNREALEWLTADIVPRCRSDVRFRVVGRGSGPSSSSRLDVSGFVDALETVWADAIALVVPMRTGGGTRLKVLEAFASGVPVVSTAFGVEGTGARPGEHYVRAETSAEFVAAIDHLTASSGERARMAAAARALVAGRFTWDQAVAPLIDIIRALPGAT